ncbi:MAG: hypothetical protein J07HR59_00050, partial [Halorubrum sp. J07HR59]
SVACARESGTERAKQMMTALYRHPALLAPCDRSVRTGAERLETANVSILGRPLAILFWSAVRHRTYPEPI